jgi:hypothetical protein
MKLAANKRSEEICHRKEILGMNSADSGEQNTANNTTNATSKIANSIGRTVPPPTSTTVSAYTCWLPQQWQHEQQHEQHQCQCQ